MGDLSPNFSRADFACKCGCGVDAVSPDLVERLQKMWDLLGTPITVQSGCRCPAHNKVEGGSKTSSHLTVPDLAKKKFCQAADLHADTDKTRYGLIETALAVGIRRIGIGTTFVHVDVDAKTQKVVWLY